MKKGIVSFILLFFMLASMMQAVNAAGTEKRIHDCCGTGIITFEEFLAQKGVEDRVHLNSVSYVDNEFYEKYPSILNSVREAVLKEKNKVYFDETITRDEMYKVDFLITLCFRSRITLDYTTNSNGQVTGAKIIYLDEFDRNGIEAFYEELDNMIMLAEPDMTDLEKALVVHDYMALNYEYDLENYENDTIPAISFSGYGIMVNKTGVCMAYSLAYQYVLSTLGIPCEYVSSDDMNHAWNYVYIDNEWYHVDVTWDDPVSDRTGRARHEHFLFSDEGAASRDHYGWESDIICSDTKYDEFFWTDIDSRIVCLDDYIYYLDYQGIHRRKGIYGEEEDVYNNYDIVDYSGFDFCNGKFYYVVCYYDFYSKYNYSIGAYDIVTQNIEQVPISVPADKEISGLYINGKYMYYTLCDNETYEQEDYVLKLVDSVYVRSITLSAPEEMYVGKSNNISAAVKPLYADNQQLEWSVSDESVARITQDGILTAAKEGVVTVAVSAMDGSGVSASCDILVTQPSCVPVAAVISSVPDGMIAKNAYVALSTDTVGATIYYTTDGTEPTEESAVYSQPIKITQSAVVKAKAVKEGREDSKIYEFEYEVVIPKSMVVTMDDYAYTVWGSGTRELSTLKFNIRNNEGPQDIYAILAVYDSGGCPIDVSVSDDIIVDGNENSVVFSDIDLQIDTGKQYTARVFVFGRKYQMFPFGQTNNFNISALIH